MRKWRHGALNHVLVAELGGKPRKSGPRVHALSQHAASTHVYFKWMDLNVENKGKDMSLTKIEFNKLSLCRHPLKRMTGTDLQHLATCLIPRTGRSVDKNMVPTSTENWKESEKLQEAPPCHNSLLLPPWSHRDTLRWPRALGWSDMTSLGDNHEGSAGSQSCCPAQALCQEHEYWVPWWICEHEPMCPQR